MSSVIRLSRWGKIAALTAAGGSFYFFRDEIRPYLRKNEATKLQTATKEPNVQEGTRNRLIENLPESIPYLLVGAGTASHSAMRSIRGHDPRAKVLMIGGENNNPYMRPALSKELWFTDKDKRPSLNFNWIGGKDRSIFYEIDEFFIPLEKLKDRENGGVSIVKNLRLSKLDPDNKVAYLENGQSIKYEKCLLAPGGTPKSLPQLDSAPQEIKDRIIYFRTADDFLKLDKITETAKRIIVIGGGFLGSELTIALVNQKVTGKVPADQVIYQIYPEKGNLGKVLPEYLSSHLTEKIAKEGAHLIPNVEVSSITMAKDKSIEIALSDGQKISVDYIVCAVGLKPDVDLARTSGLEVDEKTGGFLVNSELEARTNVWVAGDASCYYDTKLGRRRVEHHDHAINSGKLAGQNMVGSGKAYTHQSMFWSDLGQDISFEAVGIIDSSLPTVAVFAKPELKVAPNSNAQADGDISTQAANEAVEKKIDLEVMSKDPPESDKYDRGVVFYMKDNIIVGILLWNIFSRLTLARRILHEQRKYDDLNEVAKLFNIHLED